MHGTGQFGVFATQYANPQSTVLFNKLLTCAAERVQIDELLVTLIAVEDAARIVLPELPLRRIIR